MGNQSIEKARPVRSPGFFQRYRDFLLSKETIFACINGVLLLCGFVVSLFGAWQAGRWLYFGSAVLGGIPLFMLTGKAMFVRRDITAGFMASTAVIAAIIIGEFSAAALVVFMFAIGDWLESFTVARANNALRDLAKLVPPAVTVRRGGAEKIVPIDQVVVDETVLVHIGERIGVDGVVSSGSASVNQSVITGESMPVEKASGDEVYAGTLNEAGTLEVRVTRVGQNTTIGQITALVKDAQATQAPVQRVANRYAKFLVPATFAIAILVFILTRDLTRSITILVVVCPCALVLATPTAVVAAIGNAARRGILVKSGAVMENAGKIDAVAFDKTGTLTMGKPRVQDVVCLSSGLSSDELLATAAAAERFSEHPLGRAVIAAANDKGLAPAEPMDFQVAPGLGVAARVRGRPVAVGNRRMMDQSGVAWPEEAERRARDLGGAGHTVMAVAVEGRLAGLIAVADTPRPGARAAVAELKRLGVRDLRLVTGDNPLTGKRIAEDLGIDNVAADVLPAQKMEIVRGIQAEGRKVAFVGDGVNDAPALAAADIGVAMGLAGTDVALETAGIGLMADEIERLPHIIGLSRAAHRVIRQNVIFSMSMNVLAVILGGLGIIGPVFGAVMHELSALPVLANAARLINTGNPRVVKGTHSEERRTFERNGRCCCCRVDRPSRASR